MPWPSGPVVVSMPDAKPYSGWPAVLEPSCRKRFELVDRHVRVAGQIEAGIEQHRAVASRQDETVAVGPLRVQRIEFQVSREQHGGDVGAAHRQAWVAGIRLLDRVHGKEAYGVRHPVMLVARGHGSSVGGFDSWEQESCRDTYQARLWCQQNEALTKLLRLSRPALDEVDEGPQRRRHVAAAGIVEERPGEGRQPVFENAFERPALQMRRKKILEGRDKAEPGDRRGNLQFDRIADQRPCGDDPDDLAVLLEFPGRCDTPLAKRWRMQRHGRARRADGCGLPRAAR